MQIEFCPCYEEKMTKSFIFPHPSISPCALMEGYISRKQFPSDQGGVGAISQYGQAKCQDGYYCALVSLLGFVKYNIFNIINRT